MAYRVISPRASFITFSGSNEVNCLWGEIAPCYPVVNNSDVAFMFIVEADTEGEINALAAGGVTVGIIEDCDDAGYLVQFATGLQRAKSSPTQVLYMQTGLPGAMAALAIEECFKIRVEVFGNRFCSTECLQRIEEDCYTSVIDYSGDGAFGFPCATGGVIEGEEPGGGGGAEVDCAPTIITFINVPTLTIPYTAELQAKHGDVPSSEVYIYDEIGVLTKMGITAQLLGGIPPTHLYFDFGGNASGVIRLNV